MLSSYLYGLRAKVGTSLEESFGDDDCGCAAVRGGTALKLCERIMDHLGGEDLLEGVDVAELRVGVFGGM